MGLFGRCSKRPTCPIPALPEGGRENDGAKASPRWGSFCLWLCLLAMIFLLGVIILPPLFGEGWGGAVGPRASGSSSFTDEIRLRTTPVKNQEDTQLCWAFAMLATIETTHLELGDSVNLSPYYIISVMGLQDRKKQRGVAPDLLTIIRKHGICGWDACRDIDTPAPRYVFMLGVEYTPQQFARSVCRRDEYITLTHIADARMMKPVELKLKDSRYPHKALNVPKDTLLARIDSAIFRGQGVCWEGELDRKFFDWDAGVAVAPKSESNAFPADNHCMAIIGKAHDEKGLPYYIMKNSWGDDNAHKGFIYVHRDYVRQKTVCVVLPRQ